MKKPVTGECRICGANTVLTFEHVPPESAFNNSRVKLIPGDEAMRTLTDENRDPWDFDGLKYSIQQKGSGGYYLCDSCNNKTGAWYIPAYLEFLYGFLKVPTTEGFSPEKSVCVKAKRFRPLAVFKQVMTMFCDINHFCPHDQMLKDFLLNKDEKTFNTKKYRVFMYLFGGGIQRTNGIAGIMLGNGEMLLLSEIVSPPLGFMLYIDLPQNVKPFECEITDFCSFEYDAVIDADIILPIHECNIDLPGDFRLREQIKPYVKENSTNDKT